MAKKDYYRKEERTTPQVSTSRNTTLNSRKAKTNKDLSIALGMGQGPALSDEGLRKRISELKITQESYDKIVLSLKSAIKNQKEFNEAVEHFNDLLYFSENVDVNLLNNLQKKKELKEKEVKLQGDLIKLVKELGVEYKKLVSYNQDIYKISHDLQLESNITWKQFSQIYSEAYKNARLMNDQIGKSLHTSKELIATVSQLSKDGWKDIDSSTLVNISSSVLTLTRTLGVFPAELNDTFRQAYRQFGDNTDRFITILGDRLNAFSKTFGISVGMLSSVVAEMSEATSFLLRNNMEAQLKANASIMQATALAGRVGLTSGTFIADLAQTAQLGTAEQMAKIYQGGALLQGFNTDVFREQLRAQNYDEAIKGLFASISQTINATQEPYLRAEYIQRIGGAFGLSQDDLLRIATHGDRLEEYDQDLKDKLLKSTDSMLEELKDYKVAWADRWDAWLSNTGLSEIIGKTYNELGLYGLGDKLTQLTNITKSILAVISMPKLKDGIFGQDANAMGVLQKLYGVDTNRAAIGKGLGTVAGLGIAAYSNYKIGSNLSNPYASQSDRVSTGILGTLASAGGGALTGGQFGGVPGAIIGGVIGAGVGIANSVISDSKRREAITAINKDMEETRLSRTRQQVASTNPIINAIEDLKNTMVEVVYDNTDKTIANENINRAIDTNERARLVIYSGK